MQILSSFPLPVTKVQRYRRPILLMAMAFLAFLSIGSVHGEGEELPADLKNELVDIQAQIDSVATKLEKLDQTKFDLSVQEIRQRVEEFSLEAELLDDDPVLASLNDGIEKLTKRWPDVVVKQKEAMAAKNAAPKRSAIKPEELDALITLDVDMNNISFKRDVAPIVVNACARCHQGGTPAGEFNATTFESFVSQITPGDPDSSHLLNLVTGKEEPRMPRGNQNRFSKQWVDIWTAWIRQGAKFDGPDPKAPLASYMIDLNTQRTEAIGKMPDAKLEEMHRGYAQRHIEIVGPKTPPSFYESENFLVYTTLGDADTEYVAVLAEAVLEGLREQFHWPKDKPVWRGRFGLYVFGERYDYIAFAREIDQYSPEETEFGHVRILPAYPYLAMTTSHVGSAFDDAVARQVTSAFLTSLGKGKLPGWAVYGYARVDAQGSKLKEELNEAARLVSEGKKLEDLLGEKLPWKQLEPLSVSFFSYLARAHTKRAQEFVIQLAEDGNCWEAAKKALGAAPDPLSRDWAAWVLSKGKK